jgi:hypothetical protein
MGMLLAENFGQVTEGQLRLTSKPANICPAHAPTKRGIPSDKRIAPVIFRSSRDAVISTRVCGHYVWIKRRKERCTYIREADATSDLPFSN